jgi:hypothetical protein
MSSVLRAVSDAVRRLAIPKLVIACCGYLPRDGYRSTTPTRVGPNRVRMPPDAGIAFSVEADGHATTAPGPLRGQEC